MSYTIAFSILSATAAILLILLNWQGERERNPPGPKPWPLVGNVLDFPGDKPWKTFASWREKYGDIAYMNILGTRMVILNSLETCNDLLVNRSAIYSGRPRSIMLTDLIGFDYSFPLMTYSARWRRHRRLFHQYFNEKVSLDYRPIQERSVHHFLQRLLADPEEFLNHVRLLFGETVLDVIYDIKVEDHNNVFIQTAEKAIAVALEAAIPVRHIPSWFPGGGFKVLAVGWKKAAVDLRDLAFNHVKKKMEEGTARPSVLTSMLDRCEKESVKDGTSHEEAPEDMAKACAAIAYLGGADTTLSAVQTFFMAMANHLDTQQAAQAELDKLLGSTPDRLPRFEDQSQLPFVTAIAKELLRWHNVLPMGVPHVLMEDDEYKGYHIRKGTIVFANAWRMLHDPAVYPDPLTFNPRRWLIDTPEGPKLNPAIPDPDAIFGFGRRICPGRHFASNSLFITIANVLASFDVRPLDIHGKSAEKVEETFTSGLLIYPVPYNVSLTPRSEKLAQMIRGLEV